LLGELNRVIFSMCSQEHPDGCFYKHLMRDSCQLIKNTTDLVSICVKAQMSRLVSSEQFRLTFCKGALSFFLFFSRHMSRQRSEKLPTEPEVFSSVCALSPRDLPVVCQRGDGLHLRCGLVVTRGDDIRSAAWMGEASWEVSLSASLRPFHFLFLICVFPPPLFVVLFPHQRPYDIHASNSVESLIQLFSTISVQYSPAWPKDLVSLLRKVSRTQPATGHSQ